MIFKRITNDQAKRFPYVSGHCRYCKKPLANKRLSWCGGWRGQCWKSAMAESNWGHIREFIYKRDKGLCTICGFDIGKMVQTLLDYNQNARKTTNRDFAEAARLTRTFAFTMYGKRARNWPNDCWAVDHIRPISEGGECLAHDNLRLLDLECHDLETAKLRKRTAERRRRHRFLPLFQDNA